MRPEGPLGSASEIFHILYNLRRFGRRPFGTRGLLWLYPDADALRLLSSRPCGAK